MRTASWTVMLHQYVEANRSRGFSLDEHNCAFFVADWIRLSVGVDPAADYRELPASGRKYLLKDYPTLVEAVMARHGWPVVAVAQAQRGDVVERVFGRRHCMGICVGEFSVFVGEDGLQMIPTLECQRAWRIE